ncbi:GNAT family N-acetyltransferase [bacterium]|nr:GNAT family N-acetyltransferase [bacterium]
MSSPIKTVIRSMSELKAAEPSQLVLSFLNAIDDIFFESSAKKTFKDQAERDSFKYKYLGYYLEHHPELFLVCYDENQWKAAGPSNELLGYICGSPDTLKDTELVELNPYLEIFKTEYESYPAHLHINCHARARGKGIGSRLISSFESSLKNFEVNGISVKGLHLITSPEARNVGFYERNGYTDKHVKSLSGNDLLLMGKTL